MITRGFTDNRIITRGMGRSIVERILEAICTFNRLPVTRVFTQGSRQRIFKKGC